ncbi:MAG TPA: cytochrome c1 [Alphaproteobacteria bacterium]|jgi:ubiquinol-cytochrome c reductase cytochrome c1 subunit|nr:cytochrome c1 [Alphaproteobacteria bacterium]
MRWSLCGGIAGVVIGVGAALAAVSEVELPERRWSFAGMFGTFERDGLRRGYEVYRNVCAGCHGLSLIRYRELAALGYSAEEIKALAAEQTYTDGPNDQGEMFERPGLPADPFKSPFPNEPAARVANNGALPPDLSLIVEARKNGANHLYAVLIGYEDPPADFALKEGQYYNKYFPGHVIAMPPPLAEGAVTYADGTEATVPQMAADVTSFLAWTAEPNLEARKRMGVKTVLFLIVLTGLLYAVKRKIWLGVRH